MRTVIGLVKDKAEARRTRAELTAIGAAESNISILSGNDVDGPIASYLDASTAAGDPEGLTRALVRMGLGEEEARRYVMGVQQGYTLETVSIADADAPRALEILRRHTVQQENLGGTSGRAGAATPRAGARADLGEGRSQEILPVIVEEIAVGTREVGAGGVHVASRVKEVPVEQDVSLREERVDVERRKVDRRVSPEDAAFENRDVELTATREEPVIAKNARVVEEVVVTKGVDVRKEKIRDTVRRTEVDVQQIPFEPARYQEHYRANLSKTNEGFDTYEPAYRFGHELRARGKEEDVAWNDVEGDARSRWEKKNPGTWERFSAAIRHAWERAKGH